MSSSISSTEIVETTTVAYAWAGTANASQSVERVNGIETRRNLVPNPSFTLDLAGWTAASATTLSRDAARAKLVSKGGGRSFLSAPLTVVAGATYTVSADVMLPAATTTSYRLLVEFYSDLNSYTYVGETSSAQAFQAATPLTRVSHTFDVPAKVTGVVIYPLISTGTAPVNETVYVDSVLMEARGASAAFFDGSTQGGSSYRYALSRPLQVLGYESQRASANVFHDVIGRSNPDATLRPAGLRTGTLSYLFDSESMAAECERMHAGTAVLSLDDPELPTIAMQYVADGSITRQLDSDTRALWLVGVAFREVRP